MALQMILGRSGAGKSYQLYQRVIEQSMKHPRKQYFVIVPEQFTMQTQKDLVAMHPNHGIYNIDVLSFMRLAYRVFEEQGGMKRTVLEDTGKSMLVRRVITEKKDQLQVFQNYAKKPGYISEIKSLLSEFYQYDIKADTMAQMLLLSEKKPMLKRKLEDMQVIYQGFEEQLAEKYITSEEILDVMTEQLENTELFQNVTLALDGFTGFTPVQYKLLQRLLRICEDVLVTVTIDPMENPNYQKEEFALFHLSRETIEKLTHIAKEEGVEVAKDFVISDEVPYRFKNSSYLAHLEKNLYRFTRKPLEKESENGEGDDIVLFAGKNMQGEVDYTIREIFRLVKEKKYRYREIAVVTGDMESYSRLLEKAFAKEQIPCFIDYKKDILGNPLVELLRTLIQLFVRDFDYESVFRYLRCGLVDMDEEQVDKLENYVLALGIKRYNRWKKPWDRLYAREKLSEEEKQERLDEINDDRLGVIEELQELAAVFQKKVQTVSSYTTALHSFLLQQKIYQKLKVYEQKFEQQGMPLLAKEYSQVYELVLGIFDKLVQLLGEEEVTLSEYGDLLETGFTEVKVGLIPPGVDQIVVGDIERTRLKDIKALFFLGVNEGIVPKSAGSGGILSDMEREMLAEHEITLAPTARQTVFTQQFYLYLNLTKPQQRLYLTYHKVNGEGKPVLPSGLIRTIQKIFPKLSVAEEREINVSEPISVEDAKRLLCNTFGKRYLIDGLRSMDKEELADWWKELYTFYAKQEEWSALMSHLAEGVGFTNGENPLSKQVAAALYGTELKNSVTRIETYAACAYAHFLQYGLQLKERVEYQFGGVDYGNVFHRVLRIFPQQLKEKGLSWGKASKEEIEETVGVCLQKVTEDYGNEVLKSSQKNAYLIERMERMINRTVWALTEQLKEGSFEPTGYEIYFTCLDGLESARMDLGEERMLRLNGQIDRLDQAEEEETVYIKVIDYKSGKMTFDISSMYYGLQMQLVVYLNAALEMEQQRHKDKKVKPAGIFYYNIDDPMVERADSEEAVDQLLLKELRMNGLVNKEAHVISLLDRAFGMADSLSPSTKSWVIPVETVKDGSLGKRSSVASDQEFQQMGNFVREKIAKEGQEILDGNIAISPYRQGDKNACKYCAYQAVCNFDTKLPGNQFRTLKKLGNDQVWKAMEMEADKEKNRKGGERDEQ